MKATSQQLLLTGTGSLGDNLSAVLIYLTKNLPVVLHLVVNSQSPPVPMIPLQGTRATASF